jgi:hypothetical protein
MLGVAELVEKTMLGNVICEEAAAATELDKSVEEGADTDTPDVEPSTEPLEAPVGDPEVDEVALVI